MSRRKKEIVWILLGVVVLLAYASLRSEYHLRSQMPPEFFNATAPAQARRADEKRAAEAYWNCAVTQIQWDYGYARRLPDLPPADFVIQADQAGAAARDPVLRARYWQKLREVWVLSSSWQQRYTWSPISLRESFRSAGDWLETHMRRIVGYSW
jgi:hypothetical protein